MSAKFTPKGHDGKSADLPGTPNIPASPVTSPAPYLASAMGRCGSCGTGHPMTGRPGTSVERFECRSCKTINTANGALGFRFEGWN